MKSAEGILSWVGIATAVSSALVKLFADSNKAAEAVWFGLVATSVTALWGAFILYTRRADEERRRAEAIYRAFPTPPASLRDNLDRWLLLETLKRGSFGGCSVDTALWTAFGQWLLGASEFDDVKRMQLVYDAIAKSTITISGKDHIYHMMHVLLRSVLERNEEYDAITTPDELLSKEADRFILSVPTIYASRSGSSPIRRILVVKNFDELHALSAEISEGLRQVNDVVRMKYVIRPDGVENFGVYGSVAVGVLNGVGNSAVNCFHFDEARVRGYRTLFNALWDQGSELTDDLIGAAARMQKAP